MGKYSRIIALLVLLASPLLVRAEVDAGKIDQWIEQLSDPDPQEREKAATLLQEQGESARPALVKASRSPRPAIASGAGEILMKLPWYQPGDSDSIVKALRGYGEKTQEQRIEVLSSLGNSNDPQQIAAMLRVLPNDPSPEVRWTIAISATIGPGWDEPIKSIEKTDAAPLLMLLGRFALQGQDPKTEEAAKFIRRSLDGSAEVIFVMDVDQLLHLSNLTAALKLHKYAGLALDAALDKAEPGTLIVNPDNNPEEFPDKAARALAQLHFMKDAESRKDQQAIQTHVDKILALEPTDMSIFLDALPSMESLKTPKDKIDAFFQRVYDKQHAKLKQFPTDPMHQNSMAWLLARSARQLPEADKLATQAVAASPDTPAYLDTLAEVKFRLGQTEEAIRLEEKAITLDPKMPFLKEQLERFRKGLPTTTAPTEN